MKPVLLFFTLILAQLTVPLTAQSAEVIQKAMAYMPTVDPKSQSVALFIGRGLDSSKYFAVQQFDKDGNQIIYKDSAGNDISTTKNLRVEWLAWDASGYALIIWGVDANKVRKFKVAPMSGPNGTIGTYSNFSNIVRNKPAPFLTAPSAVVVGNGKSTSANLDLNFKTSVVGDQAIVAVKFTFTPDGTTNCKTNLDSGPIYLSDTTKVKYVGGSYYYTFSSVSRLCTYTVHMFPYNTATDASGKDSGIQMGEKYYTTTVKVPAATVPVAPIKVAGIAGYGSIKLTWLAPTNDGGVAVSKYSIYSNGKLLVTTSDLTNLSYTFTGLNPSQSYTYQVTAHNSIGESVKSTASTAVAPLQTVKPSKPLEVTAINYNSKEIIIKWKKPESDGGSAITSYTIYDNSNKTQIAKVSDPNLQEITLTNLVEGKSYVFYMKAVNANGSGDSSELTTSVTTKKVYCAVTINGAAPTKASDPLVLDIKSDGIAQLYYSYMFNNISGSNQNGTILDAAGKPIVNYIGLNAGTLAVGSWVFAVSGKGINGYSYSCQPQSLSVNIK